MVSLEPDVTVNGATLKMIQAGDGNWYAYIAEKTMAENADNLLPLLDTRRYSTADCRLDTISDGTPMQMQFILVLIL